MKRPSPWVLGGNTLGWSGVGAFLGYMAFGTEWHAVLFGFLFYLIQFLASTVLVQAYKAEDHLRDRLSLMEDRLRLMLSRDDRRGPGGRG